MTRQEFERTIEAQREVLEKEEKYSTYWYYIYGGLITLEIYYKACFRTAKKSYLTELLSKS